MGMEQMDMFSFVDNLNKDPITNTTCVVMDGELSLIHISEPTRP